MSGRAATDRVLRGRFGISVNDPGHPTPPGWVRTPLTDIADLGTGHTPSRNHPEYWDGDVPWIGIRDAGAHHGGIIERTAQTITPLGLQNSAARLLPKDTVCLSRTASVGYVVKMGRDMATSQDFVTWTCSEALDPDFLMSALLAEGEDIRKFGEGSTHTTIYFPAVKAFHLDLPPITEQRRIVATLDALTARIARARAELDRVPLLAEKTKKTLLSSVFDIVRKAEYQKLEELSKRVTKGESPKWQGFNYAKEGILFVRSQNVGWGKVLLDERTYLDPSFNSGREKSVLKTHDVLLNIVGASIGRSAVATEEIEGANCNQAVAIIRLNNSCLRDAKFISYWLQSPEMQKRIISDAVDVARANLSLASIRSFFTPWPDESTRGKIVMKIEAAFARADRLEAEAVRARKLLDRLESAILTKAFRGELVPQDENDEPAEKLLERIRAERAAAPKPKRGRSKASSPGPDHGHSRLPVPHAPGPAARR